MEVFLSRALDPKQEVPGGLLPSLGLHASNLRALGLEEEEIASLYTGLSGQASAFQHLMAQQAADAVGQHAQARLQAMKGFKELHRRLIDVQESELMVLQRRADGKSTDPAGSPGQDGRESPGEQQLQHRMLHALDSGAGPEIRAQLLEAALLEAKAAVEEVQAENHVLQLEAVELREQARGHGAVVQKLQDDLRFRAGTAMDEAAALKAMNDALTAEIGQLKDGATRRQRELDTEKNKVRQAARDLAKSEERTQKLKEAQKAQEFSVKMMESQLKELSNDHVRRMDHQVARFKKDMEDFTECQRRLRAVDGDLVSMRALYLDETSAHSETKAAFEEAKGEWDAAREGDLARIKELEGVAEAKRAVEGDLAAAKETIQALGTTIQELQAEIAAEEEARRLHEELHHKLNLARCAAEQSRAQARVHIQELTTDLTECKGKLEYAMDTMVKERNAKNEYRLKQEAYTNKIEAERHHIESLLDSLEETYRRAARAESQSEEAMKDYNGLQTRLKHAEDRNLSLKAELDNAHREIAQTKSLLEMETRRLADKEADMRRLRQELERKNALLEPLQAKADAGDAVSIELKRVQGELLRVSVMKDRISSELNVLNHRFVDSEGVNKQLKYQVEVNEKTVEALRTEMHTLHDETQRLSEERSKLSVELEALKKRATQRHMQSMFLQSQLETLKGNHEKASEELHDRREHMGELQQLYDAAVDELTEARKGVIRMEQEVAKARHARDVQREETKVYKANMTATFNGLESMLFAIEAERAELSAINAKLHDNHKKATRRVEELLAKHPDAALEGRPVVQSLAEVSSEVGVVSRMVVLQTDALQQLRAHVMSSEASTQQQLVEAQISANVSTRSGLEATKDLGDITYVQIARGELDRQAAQLVAAERDVAAAREAANGERARREAALTDLEAGLQEVAKQRELLRGREEVWKEDIRAMEREVKSAHTQVKMREQYCVKLAGKCKDLEKKVADLTLDLKTEREKLAEAVARWEEEAEGSEWEELGESEEADGEAQEGGAEADKDNVPAADTASKEDSTDPAADGAMSSDSAPLGPGMGAAPEAGAPHALSASPGCAPGGAGPHLSTSEADGEAALALPLAEGEEATKGEEEASATTEAETVAPEGGGSGGRLTVDVASAREAADNRSRDAAGASETPSKAARGSPRRRRPSLASTPGKAPKEPARRGARPPFDGGCPHCGGGPNALAAAAELEMAAPFAAVAKPKSGEDLAMMQHSHVQTDEVELWMRNHDSVQAAVFERVKHKWMREMDIDEAEFRAMPVERVMQNIRLCYEAKVRADVAVLREARRGTTLDLSDVVFNLYLHRYGDLEMATSHLVMFAASVRHHAPAMPDVALFALSCAIMREKELPASVIAQLPLTGTANEPGRAEGACGEPAQLLLRSPKPGLPTARLSDEPLGALLANPEKERLDEAEGEEGGPLETVGIWTLLEELGLGLAAEDPEALLPAHRAAWRSVATHMAGVPGRRRPHAAPCPEDVVHPVLPWIVTLTASHPGMSTLLKYADSFEYHRKLRSLDLGVPITPLQAPHVWYLLHQACQLLRVPSVPELYIRPGNHPEVYFLEVAPLVRLEDPGGGPARVPWQRSPVLVVTSATLELLNPSELQVMMAGALGVYLAPGGGGYDVNLPRPEGERLAALASIASVAVLRPELLKAQLPASVVLSWNAGLGTTLARLREYLHLCGDRAALFASQDIHLSAGAILKMSSGCKVLCNTMNPDALLEEARQGDQAALQPMPHGMAMDLITSHSSMAILRVREVDHFMSSDAYQSPLKEAPLLAPTVTVPSSVRAPTTPSKSRRLFELEDEQPYGAAAAMAGTLLASKAKNLRKVHKAAAT